MSLSNSFLIHSSHILGLYWLNLGPTGTKFRTSTGTGTEPPVKSGTSTGTGTEPVPGSVTSTETGFRLCHRYPNRNRCHMPEPVKWEDDHNLCTSPPLTSN